MDILDRLEHFKGDREAYGDRYGAEVLHHAIAEIARLTKLRALDEQQFQRLKASFDEVVRQRDEYRLALDEREARIADVRKNLLVGMDKLIEAIESGYDVTEMVEGLKRIVAEARQAGEGEGHEQKA